MSGKKLEGISHFVLLCVANWFIFNITVNLADTATEIVAGLTFCAVVSMSLGYKGFNIIENK